MVAAAKLRRSQQALVSARPYANQLAALVGQLAAAEGEEAQHPLLVPREEVKNIRLYVLTSDRGFCGGFNGNLLRRVVDWREENQERLETIELQVIGRKGRDFFKARGIEVAGVETGIYEDLDFGQARQRAEAITADYAAGAFDECWFVYNQFKSAINQEVTFEQIVPVAPSVHPSTSSGRTDDDSAHPELVEGQASMDYIYEPLAPQLLGELIPRYVATSIFRFFLESIASEFGSRMVAMDGATNNCEDMIGKLTLTSNRLRQAVITSELMDIVNGAEALG